MCEGKLEREGSLCQTTGPLPYEHARFLAEVQPAWLDRGRGRRQQRASGFWLVRTLTLVVPRRAALDRAGVINRRADSVGPAGGEAASEPGRPDLPYPVVPEARAISTAGVSVELAGTWPVDNAQRKDMVGGRARMKERSRLKSIRRRSRREHNPARKPSGRPFARAYVSAPPPTYDKREGGNAGRVLVLCMMNCPPPLPHYSSSGTPPPRSRAVDPLVRLGPNPFEQGVEALRPLA